MTGGVRPFTLADPASAPKTDDAVNDKSINTKTIATTERTPIAAPKSKTLRRLFIAADTSSNRNLFRRKNRYGSAVLDADYREKQMTRKSLERTETGRTVALGQCDCWH
jgi:hypothetical protein